ncbi:MAG: EamA/RhaT family transporter [Spirochaetes bacterium]|nr:MAG: EamA/RhaT family transporter [Spirochaetota bacterium]
MRAIEERRAYIPASGAIALWSTVAVAFKLALRELTPYNLVAVSVFFSWLSLGAVLLIRQGVKFQFTASRRSVIYSAALGLLNPLAYYWILFAAYNKLPAQAAQPLNYTWPLFLALLAAPISGKKPTGRDLLGLFISLAGVVLIAHRPGDSLEKLNPVGIALALGSGIIWAFSWLAGTRIRIEGTLRLFISFSTALIVLAVFWIRQGRAVPSSSVGWISVIWVGLFEMGITFLLWNAALERTRTPARIGNLVYLGPFISLLWISLILGETIRPATVAGLAVIISGILIGQNRKGN